MKKMVLVVYCLNLFVTTSIYANEKNINNRLIFIQGHVLNAYYQGEYKEIKRAEIFYGFGWLDEHRVFVAHQDPATSEAVAILEIIDLNKKVTVKLTSFGGAGESHFDVNSNTGDVVYNDSSGIHVLEVDKNNSFVVHNIQKDINSWAVFWIDNTTVGTILFENGKKKFKKIKIISQPLSLSH